MRRRTKTALALVVICWAGFAWWRVNKPEANSESIVLQTDSEAVHFVVADSDAAVSAPGAPSTSPARTSPSAHGVVSPFDHLVWDLCGVGRLPIPQALLAAARGDWAELPKHLGEGADQLGRQALLNLMARGESRARAAAMLWRQTSRSMVAAGLRDQPNPAPDTTNTAAAALLELAESSHDAVIASWALSGCLGDEPCRKRASAVWLRTEPDNAAAWLPVLRLQPERREEVFAAIAKAQRFTNHYGVMAAVALAAMPNEVPPYVQQNLLIEALGFEVAQTLPDFQSLTGLCKPAPAANSDEQSRCDAIARLLIERSDTLIAHLIGSRIAELAGWPKAQEENRRAQTRELMSSVSIVEFHQPMSCAAVEKSRAWVRDVANKGELATVRERASAALTASSPQR